jgi:hypothetical protein
MPNNAVDDVEQEDPEDVLGRRIFWRIVFDVFDHEVRLQQIVTCWRSVQRTVNDENGNPVPITVVERGFRKVVNLQYQIIGDVTIANDRAVFNGGYLECESADLTAYADDCELGDLEETSQPINGENVSIRADVRLRESNIEEPFPLFHYPQSGSAGVALAETVDAPNPLNLVTVDWAISGLAITSALPFRLEAIEGWHRVRVQQDKSGGGGDVFEMWADSAWLGDHPIADPTHQFDPEPQTFYIGRASDSGPGLFGEISHLEFDPNDSCGNCLMIEPNPDIR